jgi:anti-sigma28 factor (negative regulator of flagellin synthesis)
MKLEPIPPVSRSSPAVSSGSGGARVSDTPAADGITISNASAALNNRARVERLTAAVQDNSYQVDSEATSQAIVRHAL